MGHLAVQQDSVEFDVSVRFTLENLRELLTGPPEGVELEPCTSTVFWPGYSFKVSRSADTTSKSRKCRLSLYLLPGDNNPVPSIAVYPTVTVQSLNGDMYSTKSLRRQTIFDHGRTSIGTLLSQKTYETSYTMQREDAVIVVVNLRSSNVPTPRSKPTLNLIHRVLTAQPLSDVRFIVFRRRASNGHLSCPRVFHANMKDLASHYERSEGLLAVDDNIEGFELPRGARLGDYNLTCEQYECDSDFEPDDEEDEEDGDMVVVKREVHGDSKAGASLKTHKEMYPDSITTDSSRTLEAIQREVDDSMHSSTSSFDIIAQKEGSELYSSSNFEGTTIVLLGAASRTWEALLYYLYTGCIEFAPLTQNESDREDFFSRYRSENTDRPTPPSCRSIYRLAHKLELEGLRKLALQHLESQLSPETVLTDVFSEFTARYDEVKEMELSLVVRYWNFLKASAAFKEKMVEVTSGSIPHAADIISEIMLRVSALKG